eukprot:CAMPEP_0114124184 /NCGR_PEP_ID=MMETSP0043_2-20121206/8648_1 /TAXON_ID=464988 /ORGANISM="Hemiselmis andersenii, Strain CCMP644" /LENGTH=183 /DNA_ID=CAMNT_0001217059 /DNA_START=232 /DNA_END=783 /DNA_ORIENTATION=-
MEPSSWTLRSGLRHRSVPRSNDSDNEAGAPAPLSPVSARDAEPPSTPDQRAASSAADDNIQRQDLLCQLDAERTARLRAEELNDTLVAEINTLRVAPNINRTGTTGASEPPSRGETDARGDTSPPPDLHTSGRGGSPTKVTSPPQPSTARLPARASVPVSPSVSAPRASLPPRTTLGGKAFYQ